MKTSLFLTAFFLLFSACDAPSADEGAGASMEEQVRATLNQAVARYGATAATHDPAAGYPRSTEPDGSWRTVPPGDWTSGFFPGILWYLYEYSEEPALREQAHRWTLPLVAIFEGRPDHDLGFQFYCSFGNGYRITGDEAYKGPMLTAAEKLAARFNPTVGAIKSWDWSDNRWAYPVIADNMMNLELLLWAAENGGDAAWRDVALAHARTTILNHFREDNGSYHVVNYDPATGEVTQRVTHQGAADESTWARGQAWLVYGFTMMHRETGEAEFLQKAREAADYFITRLPDDMAPYWDFQAPGIPDAPRDASAAAIVTSALFDLADAVGGAEGAEYRQTAERMLASLMTPAYLAPEGSPSLLLHAVGNHPANGEIDVSLIYGDYYFVEALTRYLGGRERS